MFKLRLQRHGRKGRPFYWIVAADSRSARDGAFKEKLGTYDPMIEGEARVLLKSERIQHWLSVGAQPTERLARLWKQYGPKN